MFRFLVQLADGVSADTLKADLATYDHRWSVRPRGSDFALADSSAPFREAEDLLQDILNFHGSIRNYLLISE